MKKAIISIMFVLMLAFVGCQSTVEDVMENRIAAETGENVDVDADGDKVTITTDDGIVKSEVKNKDSWCQEGSTWDMATAEADANMVVVGIESSGKYAGYCHITYNMDSEDTNLKMDYYFDEEGNGYQVMDIDGRKVESEWSN